MRRIFLEIFAGSFLCFLLALVTVSYYFEDIRPDYDTQLAVAHVSSFARVVDDITVIEKNMAEHAINMFVKDSFFDVEVYDWEDLSDLTSKSKAELRKNSAISIDLNEYILYVNDTLYHLFPDENYDIWNELDYEETFLLYWFGLFFLVYSLVVVYLLHRRLKPLEQATTLFANGTLTARASEKTAIRLGTLNRQFNFMAQRVSQLIASQKQLTNAVAHELRTPLFRMECQLALLEEMELDTPVKRHLDGLAGDVEELEQLVEELLHYARLEGADRDISRSQGDPKLWLEPLVEKLQLVSDCPIRLFCENNVEVNIDHAQLNRAVSNLIINATRYAVSEINVHAHVTDTELELRVSDDGPGIPESEIQNVLKPFYRVGTARDRKSGGHGLGLAIVDQVIREHRGMIAITRSAKGGADFLITIPLN